MREERLEVSVTFDERHGYVASAPELRSPVVALSLGGLRRKIEIAMLPDDVRVVLQLDGLAERERHRRRAQAQLSRIAQFDQRTALAANVCTRRKRTSGPQGGSPGLRPKETLAPVNRHAIRSPLSDVVARCSFDVWHSRPTACRRRRDLLALDEPCHNDGLSDEVEHDDLVSPF
jgi:hypothetical protein